MEFDDIVCWTDADPGAKVIAELYINQCNESISSLGNMLGCYFPDGTYPNHEIYRIAKKLVMYGDLQWYGKITDKKKYLLAKIKYGI